MVPLMGFCSLMGGGKLFDLSTSLSEYPLDGSRWRLWQVWVVIGGEWKGIMVTSLPVTMEKSLKITSMMSRFARDRVGGETK